MNKRLLTLGALTIMGLVAVEATVVGTAMPTIVGELGGLRDYSWVFTAYMLGVTVTGPIWGKLSDLYGRRGIFLAALVLFLLGSGLCGQAHSLTMLVICRLIQGIGGGGLQPLAITIIGETYALTERAKVQSMVAVIFGVASVVGPWLGGYLTDHWSWRAVFYLNVPTGLLAGLVLGALLPVQGRLKSRLDLPGAMLFAIAFSWLIWWLSSGGHPDLNMLGSLVFLGALVAWERRVDEPFLPLGLWRFPIFRAALVIMPLSAMAIFGAVSYLPLYFQGLRGMDPAAAGSALMPLLLGWVVASPCSSVLVLRCGYRFTLIGSTLGLAAGYLILAQAGAATPNLELLVGIVLVGVGAGLCVAPLTIGVQSAVPLELMGTATSALSFMRNVGAAIGVALMGAALSLHLEGTDGREALQNPALQEQLAAGLHLAFQLGLGCAIAALLAVGLVPEGSAQSLQREEASEEPREDPHTP